MITSTFEIDAYTIGLIHDEAERLREAYGPERDVGPITFELGEDGLYIYIDTQKQGQHRYKVDDIGRLVQFV
jgi:hypothetical protein